MSTRRSNARLRTWFFMGSLVMVLGLALGYVAIRNKKAAGGSDKEVKDSPHGEGVVLVEIERPRIGGIDRRCTQPGSIEPIQSADLYTKASGTLVELKVDIGDIVKPHQVLARISVPELDMQVKQDKKEVERAEAKVKLIKTSIATYEADMGVAIAGVALAKAEKESKVSYRAFREKQRNRIKDLVERMAVDAKLLDEHEDQLQAASSAELASIEAVNTAKQKEASARARVRQAEADLEFAEAEVAVAKARVERSEVFVEFATIRAPFAGVITKRNFHEGDYIRSADTGGERLPVLAMDRRDIMRVVVQVPDRDVPFVDRGDSAVIEVDALPGVVFKTQGDDKVEVTRIAASEDSHTRMMRTEIHVNNATGKLQRGMFGRVTLTLQTGAKNALMIPSSALTGKASGGNGKVRVIREGEAHFVDVQYGTDNGSDVEVLSGLLPTDEIIMRAAGSLHQGTKVAISKNKIPQGGH